MALAGRGGVTGRSTGSGDWGGNISIGAAPRDVGQTNRLLLAKQLIDGTDLSLTQVALAAGFGSVRRFNEVIKNSYGRTPADRLNPSHPSYATIKALLNQVPTSPHIAANLVGSTPPRLVL